MRRTNSWLVALSTVAVSSFLASSAAAQAKDGEFSAQRFQPAIGPRNFITVQGARTDGQMAFSLGLFVNYSNSPFVLRSCKSASDCKSPNAVNPKDVKVIESMVTGDVLASLTPIPRVQIGLRVPVTYINGDGLDPNTGLYTVSYGGWVNQCDVHHVGGGEIGGRLYPVEGLDIFANYALNLSTQQLPQGCTAPEDKRTSAHKLNVGVQVRTKAGINGEVSFHYQSAQTWGEQIATPSGILDQQFPLAAYTLLNARIGYRFFHDRAEISGTVYNALAGVGTDDGAPTQQHPFGNRIGRRFMGFFSYSL